MVTKVMYYLMILFMFLSLINGSIAQNEPYPQPGLKTESMPCPECSSTGNDYYVAAVTSNGDGSFENPFNNIQTALDTVYPGDNIYIMPGTYLIDTRLRINRAGTEENRICIRAQYPNNRPVLIRTGDINGNEVYDYGSTFDIGGVMYHEYGGEILLLRSPYYIVDGIIFDGNFALENYYINYRMVDFNEKSYRNVVIVAHYGRSIVVGNDTLCREEYIGHNGDHTIIRNCKIGNCLYDGLYIYADSVTVENTEIHHNLRGDFEHQEDAHGIVAGHLNHLVVSHCDIHHNTGDCIQIDHDVDNNYRSKLWDNVYIEHTKLWTGDLEEDAGYFHQGESPGENGIDTKTFHDTTLITHRPKMFVTNVEAYGFSQNNYISRRAVFNIKYRTDWVLDGITVYDNQIAFRIRGPWENPEQGGAHPTIKNVVAYNNGMVMRIERLVKNLHIFNSTFANNTIWADNVDAPGDTSFDTSTFECLNNLFLGEKPWEAADSSNLSVADSIFVNAAANNYQLVDSCIAVDNGIYISEVTRDRNGYDRPAGKAMDQGAYEFGGEYLIILSAIVTENSVLLTWNFPHRADNLGFEIERRSNGMNYQRIESVDPQDASAIYSYNHKNLSAESYYYRLKQLGANGSFVYSTVVEVTINPPVEFRLEQNYPNPFNPSTTIKYNLPVDSFVNLSVYNLLGQRVAVLVNAQQQADWYTETWDGKNEYGQQVASGVYIYKLDTEKGSFSKRMILLR